MQSSAAWEEQREQKIYISTVRRVTNIGAGGHREGKKNIKSEQTVSVCFHIFRVMEYNRNMVTSETQIT